MTCHNSNGWAACARAQGMISSSKLRTRAYPSLHLLHVCVCLCVCVAYGRSLFFTYFWWQVYFYILLFLGGFFLLGSEEALSYRRACAEAVFLYPEWNRNMEQWHFHPPLSQARLSGRGPFLAGLEKYIFEAERDEWIKWRGAERQPPPSEWNQCQRDSVWGLESLFFTFFFNLGFFSKVCLEDGKREQRETLLITQKAEAKVLFSWWTGWLFQLAAARRCLSKSSL